jgi:hypothetical protein
VILSSNKVPKKELMIWPLVMNDQRDRRQSEVEVLQQFNLLTEG